MDLVTQVVMAGDLSPREPAKLSAVLGKLQQRVRDLAALAPSEAQSDMEAWASDLRAYNDLVARYGYSIDRVFTEGTAEEKAVIGVDGQPSDFMRSHIQLSTHC